MITRKWCLAGDGSDESEFVECWRSKFGQTLDITFAAPLAPGDYAIVCYLSKGGMDEHGEPKDPTGAPHAKLGMISLLHVV